MTHDPLRVLREHELEPLRQELRATGARVLVVREARAAAEAAGGGAAPFDGAWVEIEALDGVEPGRFARELSSSLRPGAPVVCVTPGAWPLPELASRALLARGPAPGALRARVEGGQRRVTLSEWKRALAPHFRWRGACASGLLVPPGSAWASLPPLAVGALGVLEHALARVPLARALGARVVHRWVRR
jgi:hypothetical protein